MGKQMLSSFSFFFLNTLKLDEIKHPFILHPHAALCKDLSKIQQLAHQGGTIVSFPWFSKQLRCASLAG